MKTSNKPTKKNFKILALILVAGLAIYALLPQLDSFNTSLHSIQNANPVYILAALLTFAATYLVASATIYILSSFKLSYGVTLLIQIADGFTNKLVPAGIGAVTTNFLYLKKQTKSNLNAGYVAVTNNVVGFAAHFLILFSLIFINNLFNDQPIVLRKPQISGVMLIIIFSLIIIGIVLWFSLRRTARKSLNTLIYMITENIKHPSKLLGSLLTSSLLTFLYAMTLYLVVLSLNLEINFLQTFLVFTVSVVALTVVPTPGGIGGVEASLVAAFLAFGVDSGPALSAALTYRFITFWLPLLPGAFALEIATKKGYLAKPIKKQS